MIKHIHFKWNLRGRKGRTWKALITIKMELHECLCSMSKIPLPKFKIASLTIALWTNDQAAPNWQMQIHCEFSDLTIVLRMVKDAVYFLTCNVLSDLQKFKQSFFTWQTEGMCTSERPFHVLSAVTQEQLHVPLKKDSNGHGNQQIFFSLPNNS